MKMKNRNKIVSLCLASTLMLMMSCEQNKSKKVESKKDQITKKVKQKLDGINYRITTINSYYKENSLLRDGNYKDIIYTSFT